MHNTVRFLALPVVAVALAVCGGGERDAAGTRAGASREGQACASPPGDSALYVATQEYLKGLVPKPRRFLSAVGTDSALPEAAFRALQDAGPSYLFPRDAAGQKTVIERLAEVGPWTALLVSWHGVERVGDTTVVVRLRGRYVNRENTGEMAPARRIRFDCSADRWRFTRTEEERVT